jgi:hypothetical protein
VTARPKPSSPEPEKRKVGSVKRSEKDGTWQIRIRLADGSRIRSKLLSADLIEAEVRQMAVDLQEKHKGKTAADLARFSAKNPVPTKTEHKSCETWVLAWHAERVARGLTSATDTLSHWRMHLAAVLGNKHPKYWQRADFRKLSAVLSSKAQRGEMSPKTARNIWTTATGMAGEARSSNLDTIQCRDDDPSDGVKGPERGVQLALQYLYPAEVDQFLTCEKVPLHWRRLVAVAV